MPSMFGEFDKTGYAVGDAGLVRITANEVDDDDPVWSLLPEVKPKFP